MLRRTPVTEGSPGWNEIIFENGLIYTGVTYGEEEAAKDNVGNWMRGNLLLEKSSCVLPGGSGSAYPGTKRGGGGKSW